KGLQFNKEDRYKSAAEMSGDVRRALAELEGAKTHKATGGTALAPAADAPASASALELAETDIIKSQYGLNESIRIPKQRSTVPWLLLLLRAGGGAYEGRTYAKPWLARLKARVLPAAAPSASDSAPAASTIPAEAGAPSASVVSPDARAPLAAPAASTSG